MPGAVDQSGPVLDTFLIRVGGGGLYGHVLFTGLTGMGFAYLVTQRAVPMPRRLVGGGAVHRRRRCGARHLELALMDFRPEHARRRRPSVIQWIEYGALKGMPFLILLGVLVAARDAQRGGDLPGHRRRRARPDGRHGRRDEVARKPVGAAVGSNRGRSACTARVAARLTGQLQAAQIEYAMIRSGSDSLDDPALDAQRLEDPTICGPSLPASSLTRPGADSRCLPAARGRCPSSVGGPRPFAGRAAGRPGCHHVVPRGGMAAWPTPDGSRLPAVVLPERLQLVVEARAGPWAEVRAANGWRGWVDGRLLVDRR